MSVPPWEVWEERGIWQPLKVETQIINLDFTLSKRVAISAKNVCTHCLHICVGLVFSNFENWHADESACTVQHTKYNISMLLLWLVWLNTSYIIKLDPSYI